MISLIACIDKNRALGKNGQLLFHIKSDMQFFREITSNHTVIMGRKTWASLPSKLKNRTNIVISHHDFDGPDQIIHDIKPLISAYQNSDKEIFVIGGSAIYQEFLPYAKFLYLTEVDISDPSADVFFPDFDKSQYFSKLITKGKENGLNYSITKYVKNKGAL